MKSRALVAVSLGLLTWFILHLAPLAPAEQATDIGQRYTTTKTMVAMRDGVHLNTAVYVPKDVKGPLPFIFLRTPYGIDGRPERFFQAYFEDLDKEGYIFVFQDIRGRHKSEGQFVMARNPRAKPDPKAIDEGTDAYDTIDWLLKNIPGHNGRVGMLGVSYDGWLTAMAMLDPHPALKAVSPQASPADQFLGDDFHHNGAFRLSYGFEYVAMMETNKFNANFKFDRRDAFDWYLRLGALSNVNEHHFHGKMPTWNDFVSHPNYDEFWQKQAFAPYLTRVTIPTLNVAGWFDQEDFYGPLKIYELLEKHDAKNQNFLVVGPWNHGGWSRGKGDKLGKISFSSDTAKYFREKVQAPWFAFHLKDKGKVEQPEALVFETGTNRWLTHDKWPPLGQTQERKLYCQANGKLTFDPPPADGQAVAYDTYVSDPSRPVPYRPRPIAPTYPGPEWPLWMVEDQRFAHQRPDVLTWETDTLQEDVAVAGNLSARLFASTTGTDCDWIVRLIDVYPESYPKDPSLGGYQFLVTGEVLRGRFHKSFEKPEPLEPGKVTPYTIDLHGNHHCFQKGHRIMVQVQSTWFPLIDRNPQKYVDNIFAAKDADFQTAQQRVYRSAEFPSHISLPVLN
jgi:uncharacterized protein